MNLEVSKKPYPDDCHIKKLSTTVELIILNLVFCNPGICLRDVKEELNCVYDKVQECTICIFLKRSGFTRQKMSGLDSRRDKNTDQHLGTVACASTTGRSDRE